MKFYENIFPNTNKRKAGDFLPASRGLSQINILLPTVMFKQHCSCILASLLLLTTKGDHKMPRYKIFKLACATRVHR